MTFDGDSYKQKSRLIHSLSTKESTLGFYFLSQLLKVVFQILVDFFLVGNLVYAVDYGAMVTVKVFCDFNQR